MNHAKSRVNNLSPIGRGRKTSLKKRKADALLKTSRKTVARRDQNTCWICGKRARQVHHRHPRKMGGSNNTYINMPANLISVCDTCHARIESERVWAINLGYLCPYFRKPADWPLQTAHGHWVLLNDQGGWTDLDTHQLQDALDGKQDT